MVKYSVEQPFSAIGHRARRRILELLATHERLSVTELAGPLSISLPATLRHVRVLEHSGLITCVKVGRVQYCSLKRDGFDDMLAWLMRQKQFWDANFDRLEQHLTRKQK